MDLKRIGNGAHYSEVIDYNGILYLSGQVNVNTHEIRSQSKAIFAEIDRLLAENDSDKEHILFVTLYLSDAAGAVPPSGRVMPMASASAHMVLAVPR